MRASSPHRWGRDIRRTPRPDRKADTSDSLLRRQLRHRLDRRASLIFRIGNLLAGIFASFLEYLKAKDTRFSRDYPASVIFRAIPATFPTDGQKWPPSRRNQWPASLGMVAAFRRNTRPESLGIRSCAKRVLNGCLKRCKAVQNCDTFGVPGMVPKWPFSRGIRERAWGESNTRPAA